VAHRGGAAVRAAWLREAPARAGPGDVRSSATHVTTRSTGNPRAGGWRPAGHRALQPPGRLHPCRRHGGRLLHGAFPEELVAHSQWRRPCSAVLLQFSVPVGGGSRSVERRCTAVEGSATMISDQGLTIIRGLDDALDPARLALIVYDMQLGIC